MWDRSLTSAPKYGSPSLKSKDIGSPIITWPRESTSIHSLELTPPRKAPQPPDSSKPDPPKRSPWRNRVVSVFSLGTHIDTSGIQGDESQSLISSVFEASSIESQKPGDNFVNSICSFCEEDFSFSLAGERIVTLTCDHVAHYECLYQLIDLNKVGEISQTVFPQCPTCDMPAMPTDATVFSEMKSRRCADHEAGKFLETPTRPPMLGHFDTPESEMIKVPKPRHYRGDLPAKVLLPELLEVSSKQNLSRFEDQSNGLGLGTEEKLSPYSESSYGSGEILASMQLKSVDIFETTSQLSRGSRSPDSQTCCTGIVLEIVPELSHLCVNQGQETHATMAVRISVPDNYYSKPTPPSCRVCNYMSVSTDGGSRWNAEKCELREGRTLLCGTSAIDLERDLFKLRINTSGRVLALFLNSLEHPRLLLANDDEMIIELWRRAILDASLAASPNLITDCSIAPEILAPVAPPLVTFLVVPYSARGVVEHIVQYKLNGLSRLGIVIYGSDETSEPICIGPSRKYWNRWGYHLDRFKPLTKITPGRINIVKCLSQVLSLANKRIEHAVLDQEGIHCDSLFHAIVIADNHYSSVETDRREVFEVASEMLKCGIPVDAISINKSPASDFLAHITGLTMGTFTHISTWDQALNAIQKSMETHQKRLYNQVNTEFSLDGPGTIVEVTGTSTAVDPRLLYDTDGSPPTSAVEHTTLITSPPIHYICAGAGRVFLVQIRIDGSQESVHLDVKVEGDSRLITRKRTRLNVKLLDEEPIMVVEKPAGVCGPLSSPIPSPIYGEMLLVNGVAPILLQSTKERNPIVIARQLQLAGAKSLECTLGLLNNKSIVGAQGELNHCKMVLRAILGSTRDKTCLNMFLEFTKWIDAQSTESLNRCDVIMAVSQAKKGNMLGNLYIHK